MVGRLRYQRVFDAPGVSPEAAFAFVEDPSNGVSWTRAARSVTSDDPPGAGRRLQIAGGVLGATFDVEMVVEVHDPPVDYRISTSSPFPIALSMSFDGTAVGTRTAVTMEARPGRRLPGGGFLLRAGLQRQFDGDMDLLERSLQSLA